MNRDELTAMLKELIGDETKPESQLDIINKIVEFSDQQEKVINELKESCNKLKTDYIDLALNNKRVEDEPQMETVENQPKKIYKEN